jgi:hypothetical protein
VAIPSISGSLDTIPIGCFHQISSIHENTSIIDIPASGLGQAYEVWSQFKICELDEPMRQKEPEHIANLNAIKLGQAQGTELITPARDAQNKRLARALKSVNTRVQAIWHPY